MKRIILFLTAILLLFATCQKKCITKRPKKLKPIDWENYNDVHTVFWNCVKDCSEISWTEKSDCSNDLKNIKVFGWVRHCTFSNYHPPIDPTRITISEEEYIYECNGAKGTRLSIKPNSCSTSYNDLIDSLKIKLVIGAKCYISGKLSYFDHPTNYCCSTSPIIIINSIDDIYFE